MWLALAVLAGPVGAKKDKEHTWVGKKMPVIRVPRESWLNVVTAPKADDWKGHLVYVEFSFVGSPGCQAMAPHLVRWHKTYRRRGLRLLEINNGLFDPIGDVAADVRKRKKMYPVLWDDQGKLCKRFFVKSYPTAWLIGPDRTIVWAGSPAGQAKKIEERIVAGLKKMEEARAEAARKQASAAGETSRRFTWLKGYQAFTRAKGDQKPVLLFRFDPRTRDGQKLLTGALASKEFRKYARAHLHCVIADAPGRSNRREAALFDESANWDRKTALWLVSPDKKDRTKIDVRSGSRVVDGATLVDRIKNARE